MLKSDSYGTENNQTMNEDLLGGVYSSLGLLYSKFEDMMKDPDPKNDCVFILVTQHENTGGNAVCERGVFFGGDGDYLSFFGRALQNFVACVGSFKMTRASCKELNAIFEYAHKVKNDVPLRCSMKKMEQLSRESRLNVSQDVIKGVSRVSRELEAAYDKKDSKLQFLYMLYFEVYENTANNKLVHRQKVFFQSNYDKSRNIATHPEYNEEFQNFLVSGNNVYFLHADTSSLWLSANVEDTLEMKISDSSIPVSEMQVEDEEEEEDYLF